MTTEATILRDAATHIDQHGWCQGVMYGNGAVSPSACVFGAIRIAVVGWTAEHLDEITTEQEELQDRAHDALEDYLNLPCGNESCSLAAWNDAPNRTAHDVIAAFHAAADWWDRTAAEHEATVAV